MTDSIADRTYRSAVQQWEGNGSRGSRPDRPAFDHLSTEPDEVPAHTPADPVRVGGDAVPEPPDAATRGAIADVLEQMRAGTSHRGSIPGGDAA